jgi:hypothetical protein
VESLGLRIVEGNTLDRKDSKNLSVMSNKEIEESNKVKNFSKFFGDLKKRC